MKEDGQPAETLCETLKTLSLMGYQFKVRREYVGCRSHPLPGHQALVTRYEYNILKPGLPG